MIQLGQAEGDFVLAAADARQAAAGHRRLRHHPGDRDAAQPVLPRRAGRQTDIVLLHSALARSEVIFGDELRGYAAAGWSASSSCTPTSTACSTSPTSTDDRARPRRAHDVRLRAGRPARRPRGAPRRARACRCTIERFRTAPWSPPARAAPSPSPPALTVEADGATPILDAAESAGVLMPSGCRMGVCFGCVLPLREGAVRDLRNGADHRRRARRRRDTSRPASAPPPAPATIDH